MTLNESDDDDEDESDDDSFEAAWPKERPAYVLVVREMKMSDLVSRISKPFAACLSRCLIDTIATFLSRTDNVSILMGSDSLHFGVVQQNHCSGTTFTFNCALQTYRSIG